jgi:hypothetical protein
MVRLADYRFLAHSWAEIDPENPTAALKDKAAAHLKDEL